MAQLKKFIKDDLWSYDPNDIGFERSSDQIADDMLYNFKGYVLDGELKEPADGDIIKNYFKSEWEDRFGD